MRRRISIIAVAMLVLLGWAVAQEKVKGRLPPGFAKLGLNEEQKLKIYKIQTEYEAKIQALELQIKKLREEERAQILSVLTPQQKELYLKQLGLSETKPGETKPEK